MTISITLNYLNLRKMPDSEGILSNQLRHEIRNAASLVQAFDKDKPKKMALFQSLTQKYPVLRKYFDEKIG